MKKLFLIGLFLAGFLVGGITLSLWWRQVISRMYVSKEIEVATQAALKAEWLAELRLGETQTALDNLERAMDGDVFKIDQWAEVCPPEAKLRRARDRWLVPVKVYHQSFPAQGEGAARVNSLLATVPGRDPQSVCKSGVCQLDNKRLALLSTHTNSP